jgi:alpha-ribazole phosphatase
MRVVLLRHPAPAIKAGICYGRLDVGLTEATSASLHQLAAEAVFRGAQEVWSSPARRCRQPAEAIATASRVPLRMDARLWELDFGAWEGQPWEAIGREELDRWAADPLGFAPPGGESGAALIARVTAFHAELQRDCVVVAHGGPLIVLTALLRGVPVDLLARAPALGSVLVCQAP